MTALRPLVVPGEVAADLEAGTRREWLETNGLGGFAMGTVAGPATRRYHALLCAAVRPPLGRMVLVNRLEDKLVVDGVGHELSSNFYPGAVHPDGHRWLVEFRLDPWPVWRWRVAGMLIEREIFMVHGQNMTIVIFRLLDAGGRRAHARLFVRPLISGRDYHWLHHENGALRTESDVIEGRVRMAPYDGVPPFYAHHNGVFAHRPDWYRHFQYPIEFERGLEGDEDLFSPGELAFDLSDTTPAVCAFSLDEETPDVNALRAAESERRAKLVLDAKDDFEARLMSAADAFIVRRSKNSTVIAGYPWFTDWGRDTFIALPGLARNHELAREVLAAFAPFVDGGLIPNRFPDQGEAPEYNSVDAPLWFALACVRYARQSGDRSFLPAARAVVDGYFSGTRFGIGLDDDGLIHAGGPGLQLTWMDAKVGDWVVTPRRGKPVEVQALWVAVLEALARALVGEDEPYSHELVERAAWARSSFAASFWNEEGGYLYDTIDGQQRDATLRPNQLYALGLCRPLVDNARAERALEAVERELLTRVGLRTRARGDGYHGRLIGDQRARDGAYHEGTVWPYLLGIYADACARVRGKLPEGALDGVRAHLYTEGLGSIGEIFDGDSPHAPRGCPAQAWSVAEALRVQRGRVGEDA